MTYLVMETHPAYAVLLDEKGRYLKAANMRYQVGDTVQNIIELQYPVRQNRKVLAFLSSAAALAACLCLFFFGYYQPNYTPYGMLRLRINPDVSMTISKTERILELDALNEDGERLIENYDYHGKDRDIVTEELVERAMDMGYLSDGDTIAISVNSSDEEWGRQEEEQTRLQLQETVGNTITVTIGIPSEEPDAEPSSSEETIRIVIPIEPATQPQPSVPSEDTSEAVIAPAVPSVSHDDDDDDGELRGGSAENDDSLDDSDDEEQDGPDDGQDARDDDQDTPDDDQDSPDNDDDSEEELDEPDEDD